MILIVTDTHGALHQTETPGPGFIVQVMLGGLDVRIEGADHLHGASPPELVEAALGQLRAALAAHLPRS